MKTAQQWQDELKGETSLQSIQQIQADALAYVFEAVKENRWSDAPMSDTLDTISTKIEELQK